MPPSYPPPGYGQYGNYMPYMHQQWPPMYPPPNMPLPPQTGPEEFPPNLPYKQPYSKPAPELGVKVSVRNSVPGVDKEVSKVSGHDRRVSEEQNNESQKQKVLEEREKLKQEREIRMKKKEYLMKELERLRKQQGELLRKKRREKDGHKDPLLQEISHLQEEVMTQISNLRKEHEVAEKKRSEIEKVALILGLNSSDRPRRTSKQAEDQDAEPPPDKKKWESERSPEGQQASQSSSVKTPAGKSSALSSRVSPDKSITASAPTPTPTPEPFEYYDAGNHWCQNCNVTSGSMFDFFTHLHSKTHRKTLDLYSRPWASTPTKTVKNLPSEEKLAKPAKGSEFLLPIRGFFCLLCKEFYGDAICAEEHVTTHAHNDMYKKQMYENPLYEQRRNLDRQAGLALETSGKKRKHEDEEKGSKDKEEKGKQKREKKEKHKKEDAAGAVHKEETEVKKGQGDDKLKPSKNEEDFKNSKSLHEDRSCYSKKDEDDKYKYSKRDDKYRYSRDEEDRSKYSRRDEDDKYSRDEEYRYRYRRDCDRHDDRARYCLKDDDNRYKYGKYSDSRSKYDREQDEEKSKAEKESFKTPELGKPGKLEINQPDPPPKPYEPPKILCGPSPAMRAKLRKQSLEAAKSAPATTATSFGKFTWKKKENVLAKEAEKVAAEFIKDDEEAASQQQSVSVEDSFAKSMAVAKEIAQKLASQPTMPPPWVSNGANQERIRPNLPAPTAALKTAAIMGKPASLNTFLSIRPQNTSLLESPPNDNPLFPDPLTKALNAQKALLEANPVPPVDGPRPFKAKHASTESKPELFETKLSPLVSTPAPLEVKSVPPVSKVFMVETKSAFYEAKTSASGAKHVASEPTPLPCAPLVVNLPVSKPSPAQTKLCPVEAKPAHPAMIKIVSDVAAPGVPESEQTRTVFVKPPPFMNMGDGAQKSDKVKSSLAAAKAQELFGIFYSSISQPCRSSITKPSTDVKADKTPLPIKQAPKPQPQTQTQPQTKVLTSPQTNPNSPLPNSLTKPQPLTEGHKPDFGNSPSSSQTLSKLPNKLHKSPPPESNIVQPSAQIQTRLLTEVHNPASNNCPPSTQIQCQYPAEAHKPDFGNSPPSSQNQPKSEIQISSVWSLQPILPPMPEVAPSGATLQRVQPKLTPATHSVLENQSSTPKTESQSRIAPQMKVPEQELVPHSQPSLPVQAELQSEPQPDQNTMSHCDTSTESEPKLGLKTRGKTTPTKKTPPAFRPVRQTRSQTRYQTRCQQQQQRRSEPEPDFSSRDSHVAASDLKELDTSGPGSELEQELGEPREEEPPPIGITPETLGLPSEMTSMDFDFNFE
ncbi:hypothetical protein Q5P01_021913 [Channa striata]|uniref:U1-type domain-containing protein n=1 Tax=Channa striata TaxID=64152 RepID=A0AA88S775_CHASR|nr:hypothetical protein Q5P01_021913 [Channa striata]